MSGPLSESNTASNTTEDALAVIQGAQVPALRPYVPRGQQVPATQKQVEDTIALHEKRIAELKAIKARIRAKFSEVLSRHDKEIRAREARVRRLKERSWLPSLVINQEGRMMEVSDA